MERSRTERGFTILNFVDSYGKKWSLQESSLATEDSVWLGIDDPEPRLVVNNPQGGMTTVPITLPESILLTTRMHLNREQAKKLVDALTVFVETGEL